MLKLLMGNMYPCRCDWTAKVTVPLPMAQLDSPEGGCTMTPLPHTTTKIMHDFDVSASVLGLKGHL